jgi:hypothetical protein
LRNKEQAASAQCPLWLAWPAAVNIHYKGDRDLELTALPYTIKLDIECNGCCQGSLVRLPDGVEASFNHTEGLLVLLEGIGGRRWWQENQTQIEARVMTLANVGA